MKLELFGKAEVSWESKNGMVYSTVKPCFVKFFSCLCVKLGDLVKRLGECFIVASCRSSLAVGYLVGRLHLIVMRKTGGGRRNVSRYTLL